MSYEISLIKLLENRDKELCGRLPQIRNNAMSLLSYTSGKFPYYTPHDFSHSLNVEENLNWLIPDHLKEDMNPYELFFLIAAAWLHDWGMVGVDGEDPNVIRDEHHIRTETNFERLHDNLNFSEHEARIIGRVSKGHRKIDLGTREYDDVVFGQNNKIRQRFLAALLRIADECDITHNRTPEVIYYTINPTAKSEIEFKKHLSISGIGQLEEKHKIYISAIARDPKGAKTLRELANKIQNELDSVKGILSQHGLGLDLVDLKLETRGFIDKPIGFEINKTKIVDLLIGDHLYGNQDVAIRELVQNSIDTCKLKESIKPDSKCKIEISMENNEILVIKDNGLGMDYYEAKQFLSSIGTSFYKSDLFQERLGNMNYSPISQYGIGILSCFLICNKITIETLKEGQEPCEFSVESVYEEWRYEKGHQENPGTKITLYLNEDGKKLKLSDSLLRYFLCPEIPIFYKLEGDEQQLFESSWSSQIIYQRFARNTCVNSDDNLNELLNLSRPKYDLILGKDQQGFEGDLVLFNRGIYVCQLPITGLSYGYYICLNMKDELVDLHVSREDVKMNAKWYNFIYEIFNDIFKTFIDMDDSKDKVKTISMFSAILESRLRINIDSPFHFLESCPFIRSVLDNAYFPIISNGNIELIYSIDSIRGKNLTLYNCCSKALADELSLLSIISSDVSLVVNPYKMPYVINYDEREINLLTYFLGEKGIINSETDLRQILVDNSEVININYPELFPNNIKLVTFKHNIHPLVVINKKPVMSKDNYGLGSSYWGNILLWKQLLDKELIECYLNSISQFDHIRYKKINIIEEQISYIDCTDSFIKSILEKRKYEQFDENTAKKIFRYFKYVSYLPLVINNLSSTIVFLEAIDLLETEISERINIPRPPTIFERMKPNCKLFLAYFDRYGLAYDQQ